MRQKLSHYKERAFSFPFMEITRASIGLHPDKHGKLSSVVKISFLLTSSKVLLGIFIAFLCYFGSIETAGLILAIAIFFDVIDGIIISTKSSSFDDQPRHYRRLLDVITDRSLLVIVLSALLLSRVIGVWLFSLFVLRELLLFIVVGILFLQKRVSSEPNLPSRLSFFLLGIICIQSCSANPISYVLVYLFIALTLVGAALYLQDRRGLK